MNTLSEKQVAFPGVPALKPGLGTPDQRGEEVTPSRTAATWSLGRSTVFPMTWGSAFYSNSQASKGVCGTLHLSSGDTATRVGAGWSGWCVCAQGHSGCCSSELGLGRPTYWLFSTIPQGPHGHFLRAERTFVSAET
jgi:hypothetical protein